MVLDPFENDSFFSTERLAKCRANVSVSQCFEGIVKDSTRRELIELAAKAEDFSFREGSLSFGIGNVRVREIIREILNQIGMSDCSVARGFFFHTSRPYSVHVDSLPSPSPIPFKNLLLPLDILPFEKESHFILFREHYFGPKAILIGNTKDVAPTDAKLLMDFTVLEKYDPAHFLEEEFYQSYLTHVPRDRLLGLSIERVMPWRLGDAILFNSTQIHSSSNFRKEGIISKMGLAITLSRE